jgi:putative MATE family efflux protein
LGVHFAGLFCKGAGRHVQDLTQGSITRHLIGMAVFIGMGMVFQTLYLLVDLYFVSQIGKQATAGFSAAGTAYMLVVGATQLVAVGALSLIAQAAGRKDEAEAGLVFNQAMSFAVICAGLLLVLGYLLAGPMMRGFAADAQTAEQGRIYLVAFLPGLAAFFPSAAMSSGLRATGVVRPTMIVQTVSVLLNVALAPVLVAGWGTGRPLGVLGAGLASSIAAVVGLGMLTLVFPRVQHFLRIRPSAWAPRLKVWGRIVMIGLPSAGEFVLMSGIASIVYVVIRSYGPAAQAGFGIGGRVMQSIFMPAMAVSFAVAPIAGQNYGAKRYDRVRETFRQAAIIGSLIMLTLTALCAISPQVLTIPFTRDPAVTSVAVGYLRIATLNFLTVGLVFCCSAMFQALGDTRPSFVASASRLLTFAVPAVWIAHRGGAALETFWYLSVASVTLQAVFSFLLLRREFRIKFRAPAPAAEPATLAG